MGEVPVTWVASFVVTVVTLFSAITWRQNQNSNRIHERIDETERRFNDERVRVAKEHPDHNHLNKHVLIPMQAGFDRVEALIKEAFSKK